MRGRGQSADHQFGRGRRRPLRASHHLAARQAHDGPGQAPTRRRDSERRAGVDLRVYVGGATAFSVDTGIKISERLPLFFAIVIGLSMLLLAAVFRSIAVPIKAALMNLLSVAATYGVLVAVFQWGWGTSLPASQNRPD